MDEPPVEPVVNPYAPPAAPKKRKKRRKAVEKELEYVGFWPRVGARFVDFLVSAGLGFFAGAAGGVILVLGATKGLVRADWEHGVSGLSVQGLVLGAVASLLYHGLSEGLGGATVGKALFGLRVRSADGSPATVRSALLRSLAIYIDGFFFGVVAYGAMQRSPMQQRHGDRWADTVVVMTHSLSKDAERPSVALGLVAASGAYVLVVLLDTVLRAL